MNNTKSIAIPSRHVDGAFADRQRTLRALQPRGWFGRRKGASSVRNGPVSSVDVVSRDMRSVKAQLLGRGDYRAAWWNLYSACYKVIRPSATLERAMYAFHSMHHAITLTRMQLFMQVDQLAQKMRSQGLLTALKDFRPNA